MRGSRLVITRDGVTRQKTSGRLYSENNIGLINRLVDGNGYYERQVRISFMLRKLIGSISESKIMIVSPAGTATIHAGMRPAESLNEY